MVGMNQPSEIHVFDRALMRQRRARVASDFAEHDFLYREVAARLHEKLSEINRSFGSVLDMGSRLPVFETGTDLQRLVHTRLGDAASGSLETGDPAILIADEEALPFADASFDLVVSNMALHWVNDLPGCLIQVKRALRPDGLFLAAMLGGETLHELRASLMHGEMEIQGGVSPPGLAVCRHPRYRRAAAKSRLCPADRRYRRDCCQLQGYVPINERVAWHGRDQCDPGPTQNAIKAGGADGSGALLQ